MKNVKFLILASILLISIPSCKEKATEVLPRDAFSQNPEGIIMKSSPDVKSSMVAVVPFGEKITLTESSDQAMSSSTGDKTRWYKIQWNGKSGWVQDSSTGTAGSVTEQLKVSFAEQKGNFTGDFVKLFESSPVQLTDTYIYPGGEMEPAKMFFLAGGIMVLNSKIFTENYSNTFFSYEFMNEGKLLKIKFVDSKLNFNDYADVENSSQSVFKIDKNERTIIYHIKNKGFFFFNWGFHKE